MRDAVDGGAIVPSGLHGPDFVTARGKGLGGVRFNADVDQGRAAVGVDDEVADVVVVVLITR